MARSRNDRMASALNALIETGSTNAAAAAANVTPRTVHGYLRDPDFLRRLREARGNSGELILTALNHYALEAIERLHGIMTDPRSTQTNVVRAAVSILAEARATREIELGNRLTEWENSQVSGNARLHTIR